MLFFRFCSGNWDLKTKVPQQCEVSKIKLPPYFMEWINLKDVYLNFYNRRVSFKFQHFNVSRYSAHNSSWINLVWLLILDGVRVSLCCVSVC